MKAVKAEVSLFKGNVFNSQILVLIKAEVKKNFIFIHWIPPMYKAKRIKPER